MFIKFRILRDNFLFIEYTCKTTLESISQREGICHLFKKQNGNYFKTMLLKKILLSKITKGIHCHHEYEVSITLVNGLAL